VPFSSEEIATKEFLIALRGYERNEVKAFLRAVAEDVRVLQAGEAISADRDTSRTGDQDLFGGLGQTVANLMRSAAETAREAEEAARSESARLIRDAEEESERRVSAAARQARQQIEQADEYVNETQRRVDSYASELIAKARTEAGSLLTSATEQSTRADQAAQEVRGQVQEAFALVSDALERMIEDVDALPVGSTSTHGAGLATPAASVARTVATGRWGGVPVGEVCSQENSVEMDETSNRPPDNPDFAPA
jgi:DivIVA domain-containing protein